MGNTGMLRLTGLIVDALSFGLMVIIRACCARKNKTDEAYFLAGRNISGWIVGFSLMATIISSMKFLTVPGFAFKENWRYVPTHIGYLIALVVMLFFICHFKQVIAICMQPVG